MNVLMIFYFNTKVYKKNIFPFKLDSSSKPFSFKIYHLKPNIFFQSQWNQLKLKKCVKYNWFYCDRRLGLHLTCLFWCLFVEFFEIMLFHVFHRIVTNEVDCACLFVSSGFVRKGRSLAPHSNINHTHINTQNGFKTNK